MEATMKKAITVESDINAPVSKVWESWTNTNDITKWCNASEDWHSPYAENDAVTGGRFLTRMAAKDGSMSFDFTGTYGEVRPNEYLEYTMDDGRKAWITFTDLGNQTHVSETFEAEDQNPIEMQRGGWQAILDNFKKYTEGK